MGVVMGGASDTGRRSGTGRWGMEYWYLNWSTGEVQCQAQTKHVDTGL